MLVDSEQILFKVMTALKRSGLTEQQAMDALREIQNENIVFREIA